MIPPERKFFFMISRIINLSGHTGEVEARMSAFIKFLKQNAPSVFIRKEEQTPTTPMGPGPSLGNARPPLQAISGAATLTQVPIPEATSKSGPDSLPKMISDCKTMGDWFALINGLGFLHKSKQRVSATVAQQLDPMKADENLSGSVLLARQHIRNAWSTSTPTPLGHFPHLRSLHLSRTPLRSRCPQSTTCTSLVS